jgi:ribosomal protein L11 methyltransferase
MQTAELTLKVGADRQELLVAELAEVGFEAFTQDEEALKAYLPAHGWDDGLRRHVEHVLARYGVEAPLEVQVIGAQDWNSRWEQSIVPISVGRFLIKPTWRDVLPEQAEQIVIEIDPKMSFGTGNHESTRLVLRFLPDLVSAGAHVLDAGTGTGILAIAALKLGAAEVFAFDVDPWVAQNLEENATRNEVQQQVTFRVGEIDTAPERPYDLILANINRNILLDCMPAFARRLDARGHLVLAGVLVSDREAMVAAAAEEGLSLFRESSEGEWWSGVFEVVSF